MNQLSVTMEIMPVLVKHLAERIRKLALYREGEIIRVYGVPRGGIPVALALMAYLQAVPVSSAKEADLIVDDIIDSGETQRTYAALYPEKPFLPLVVKDRLEDWYVFPWEIGKSGETEGIRTNITRIIESVGEDLTRQGLKETPMRVQAAFEEWTSGYQRDAKDVLKAFTDGAEDCDQMVVVRNIPFYSLCEHHLAPFFGTATIGYIPDGKIVGLSKLSRVLDVFARRFQVQERLTNQVASAIDEHLSPLGCGVVLTARHLCMESRGICKQGHETITSSMKGVFRESSSTRAEFFSLAR